MGTNGDPVRKHRSMNRFFAHKKLNQARRLFYNKLLIFLSVFGSYSLLRSSNCQVKTEHTVDFIYAWRHKTCSPT